MTQTESNRTLDQIYDSILGSISRVLTPIDYSNSLKEKKQRLEKFGLVNSPDHKYVSEELKKEEESQNLTQEEQEKLDKTMDTRNHYEFKYPNLKFFTEDEFYNICEELDIEIGSIKDFYSNVSEDILEEIENIEPLKYEEFPLRVVKLKLDINEIGIKSWANPKKLKWGDANGLPETQSELEGLIKEAKKFKLYYPRERFEEHWKDCLGRLSLEQEDFKELWEDPIAEDLTPERKVKVWNAGDKCFVIIDNKICECEVVSPENWENNVIVYYDYDKSKQKYSDFTARIPLEKVFKSRQELAEKG